MLKDHEKMRILHFRVYESRLARLFDYLALHDLESVLIKGWAAAQTYPDPSKRPLGDVDIMIRPRDLDRAEEILSGFKELPVDLHHGPRHLDVLSADALFENSKLLKVGELRIRVLSPEDHLRILCVHWLTDGAEKMDRLWDIYWAIKNRPADFDWEKCLGVLGENRRRWIIYTIGLANRYLSLTVDDLPFAARARDLPAWLIREVESNWAKDVPLVPIHHTLRDPVQFFKQVRKRIPPNPIMATIGMEGSLDSATRLHYQIGYLLKQAVPSVRRIFGKIRN